MTPATISRIEGGSRGLSIERLEAIAKALDISMAELFLDEAERVEFHPVKKPHQPNPFEVAPKWAQELLDEVRSLREQEVEKILLGEVDGPGAAPGYNVQLTGEKENMGTKKNRSTTNLIRLHVGRHPDRRRMRRRRRRRPANDAGADRAGKV